MKNLITITNTKGLPISAIVENFSDTNVKEAIKELLHVDTNKLKCEVANPDRSIYGVKELYPSLKEKLGSVFGFGMHPNPYFGFIEIKYSQL